ncbi:hypothetical protein [Thermococcus piezophilus]|uniref:hypothetical protein n=1 Tax=Thermococcus piezophilus TaxID=1712654 RepID=UPI001F359B60|nr:hypothetical protein [Thermococcus piezophilus]
MRYAIDYELYGWWNDGAGRLEFNFGANEGMQLIKYENGAWLYDWQNSFPGYLINYTGDTSVSLQTIEIRIPWDALGGKKGNFAVITWITGGSGSAVSSVPWIQHSRTTQTNGTTPIRSQALPPLRCLSPCQN